MNSHKREKEINFLSNVFEVIFMICTSICALYDDYLNFAM